MKDKLKEILTQSQIPTEVIENILSQLDFENNETNEQQIEEEVTNRVQQIQIEMQVKYELLDAKAKNIKACLALIDLEGVTVVDGEVVGLSEKILKVKKENPYLFEDLEKYTPSSGETLKSLDNMRDDEYFSFIKNNGGF